MAKYDIPIPTSTTTWEYRDEFLKFQELNVADTLSEASGTWTSTSSGEDYDYDNETDLYNQLAAVTLDYRLTASEVNTINDNLDAVVLNVTTKESLIGACVRRDIDGAVVYKDEIEAEDNTEESTTSLTPILIKTISFDATYINFIKFEMEIRTQHSGVSTNTNITVKNHADDAILATENTSSVAYQTKYSYADISSITGTLTLDIYLDIDDDSGKTGYNRNFKIYGNDTSLIFTSVV